MRKPVIAGNWKMYKLIGEAIETALALKPLVANANHCEVIIAPPYTALKAVADRLEGSNIKVAAQNVATEIKHGAHTGEVCGDMLKDAGASHTSSSATPSGAALTARQMRASIARFAPRCTSV
jgi:triosephosphate isomerase